MAINLEELAKKHGATISMEDIAAKYGGKSVSVTPQQDPFSQANESGIGSFLGKGLEAGMNVGIGAIKGVAETGRTLSKTSPIMQRIDSRQIPKTLQKYTLTPEQLAPEGGAQNIGYAVEKISEYFLPEALGIKGANAARFTKRALESAGAGKLATTVLPRLTSGATNFLGNLGVGTLQSGGVTKEGIQNAALAGLFSQAGKIPNVLFGGTQTARGVYDIAQGEYEKGIPESVLGILGLRGAKSQKGLVFDQPIVTGSKQISTPSEYEGKTIIPEKKGMPQQRLGLSIIEQQVKPNAKDYSHGFNINNFSKYDVIRPSLQDTAQTINGRIAAYGKELQKVKDIYGDPRVIDLNAALTETKKKLIGQGKDFNQSSYKNAAKLLESELTSFDPTWRSTKSEFTTGWKAKAAAGDRASFERDPLKAGEETPNERFYNEFYSQIKKQLEDNAPPQYKKINEALTELFPLQKAVNRRLPVDVRNNSISLTDAIGGVAALAHPSTIPILAALKASKSLPLARFLTNLGQKEQPFIPGEIPQRHVPPMIPEKTTSISEMQYPPIQLPSPGVLSGQQILREIITKKPIDVRFKKKK